MNVPQTILMQLGAGRFCAMTGAKDFVGGEYSLQFRLPSGKCKNGINCVRITLTPLDLYTVEFIKIGRAPKFTVAPVSTHEMVYNDQLQALFTEQTGLYTHL